MMKPVAFFLKTVVFVLVILAIAYVVLLTQVHGVLQGFLLDKAVALGFSPTVAAAVVTFVALAVTPLFAGALIRASMGRLINRNVAVPAADVLVFFGAYLALAREWLFDAKGQSLAYLCPPNGVGQTPRITKWQTTDQYIGVPCVAITRENAAAVVALRQGTEPRKIQLGSTTELDSLVTHRYGHPIVFISNDGDGDLYAGPGWSHKSPELLRAVTPHDIRAKRAALEAIDAQRLAAAELARKVSARAAEAQQREMKAAEDAATRERKAADDKRMTEELAAKALIDAAVYERRAVEEQRRAASEAKDAAAAERVATAARNASDRETEQRRVALQQDERRAALQRDHDDRQIELMQDQRRRQSHRTQFNSTPLPFSDDAPVVAVWINRPPAISNRVVPDRHLTPRFDQPFTYHIPRPHGGQGHTPPSGARAHDRSGRR